MDINLARTFLEIVETRNFGRAAQRLNITQTAVSARVRTLEELLGRALFVRNKAGASLTPSGQRFMRHARTLVHVWESARHQAAVPPGRRAIVDIGCETSLWDPLLLDWLLHMRQTAPHLALRTQVGFPGELLNNVSQGLIDIAVVYAPEQRPGLKIVLLIEEKLVMVSTVPGRRVARPSDYVFVDWGREFAAQHQLAFPELSNAATVAGLGPLGRKYLLEAGGTGYFRLNVIRDHLDAGRLHLVPGAPEFLYPAYAVYSESADAKVIEPALAGLLHVARPQEPVKTKARRRSGPRGIRRTR